MLQSIRFLGFFQLVKDVSMNGCCLNFVLYKTRQQTWCFPQNMNCLPYREASETGSLHEAGDQGGDANNKVRLSVTGLFHKSHREYVKGLVTQSCPTLCDPRDCSPPGSTVQGILQARILEWVAIFFSKGSFWTRHLTWVSCIAGSFFTVWVIREAPE